MSLSALEIADDSASDNVHDENKEAQSHAWILLSDVFQKNKIFIFIGKIDNFYGRNVDYMC